MTNELISKKHATFEVGYLSPEGVLYECRPFEHIEFSNELCKKLGYKDDCRGLDGENILLQQKGWIIAKARSFEMNVEHIISKEQKYWLMDFIDHCHPLTPDEKIQCAKDLIQRREWREEDEVEK